MVERSNLVFAATPHHRRAPRPRHAGHCTEDTRDGNSCPRTVVINAPRTSRGEDKPQSCPTAETGKKKHFLNGNPARSAQAQAQPQSHFGEQHSVACSTFLPSPRSQFHPAGLLTHLIMQFIRPEQPHVLTTGKELYFKTCNVKENAAQPVHASLSLLTQGRG